MKITLERTESTGWLVVCGDRFASHLGADEALGIFAAALFGSGRLPYLRTYEETRFFDPPAPIAGLLPASVPAVPVSDFVIRRRVLIADTRGI